MPAAARKITEADILSDNDYAAQRKALRSQAIALKKHRRVEVGPYATFYFENYQTMWLQVQEMLRIEKGGKEQIAGELEAYNPHLDAGNRRCGSPPRHPAHSGRHRGKYFHGGRRRPRRRHAHRI